MIQLDLWSRTKNPTPRVLTNPTPPKNLRLLLPGANPPVVLLFSSDTMFIKSSQCVTAFEVTRSKNASSRERLTWVSAKEYLKKKNKDLEKL